jgi:membrane-bound metal-dependent hydrolase YbcI (DUF457 family)
MVEIRENFCGMCMAVPFALAGAGVAGLASKQDYKHRKYITVSISVAVLIVTFLIYLTFKDCRSCTL